MSEEWINLVLIVCGTVQPSVAGGLWLGLALMIWMHLVFSYHHPRPFTYLAFFIPSLCSFCFKVVLFFLMYYKIRLDLFEFYASELGLLGFYAKESQLNLDSALSILPDGVSCFAILAGYLKLKRLKAKVRTQNTSKGLLVFFVLSVSLVSYLNLVNLAYGVLGLVFGLFWTTNKSLNALKPVSLVVSVLTGLQLLAFFSFSLKDLQYSDSWVSYFGVSIKLQEEIPSYLVTILLHTVSIKHWKMSADLSRRHLEQPLLLRPENPVQRSLFHHYLYVVWRVMLYLSIYYFMNLLGFLIMCCLLYSILKKRHKFFDSNLQYVCLGLMCLNLLGFYVANWLQTSIGGKYCFYTFSYPIPELLFQVLLVLLLLYTNKHREKFKSTQVTNFDPEKWTHFVSRVFLQNSEKFSLTIFFLISLSYINLLHAGLIIFSLVFILSTENKRYSEFLCKVLIVYILVLLVSRYVWQLTLKFYGKLLVKKELSDLIGLPTTVDQQLFLGFVSEDVLIWLALIISNIQLKAYKSNQFRTTQEDYSKIENSNPNWFIRSVVFFFAKIYALTYLLGIWVAYSLLLVIFSVSYLDISNFIGFSVLCGLLVLNLENPKYAWNDNLRKVRKGWLMLEVYCGVLLVLKYVFQFLPFVGELSMYQFPLLGLTVYDKKELYERMSMAALTFIIVIVTSKTSSTQLRQNNSDSLQKSGVLTVFVRLKFLQDDLNLFKKPLELVAEWFIFLVIGSIFVLSVFRRLSVSMLLYLTAIGIYFIAVCSYSARVLFTKQQPQTKHFWKLRKNLWYWLFRLSVLYLIFSYSNFLIKKEFLGAKYYDYAVWCLFVLGFDKSEGELLIQHNYEYFVITALLALERHCLHQTYTRIHSQQELIDPQNSKTLSIYKMLNILRVIVESIAPLCLLLIAFQKITFVSLFYVVSVFNIFIFSKLPQRGMFYILIGMTWLQYLLILSNINEKVTCVPSVEAKPYPIPWYPLIPTHNQDQLDFMNLGNHSYQLKYLFGDMGVCLLFYVYFKYLANKEHELKVISETFQKSRRLSQTKPHRKRTLDFVKKVIYNYSHIVILTIVLVFISQSYGVISSIYCMFCLIFIYKANVMFIDKKNWESYLRILWHYFLVFMALELTLQIVYQLPFDIFHTKFDTWLEAVGLVKLWSAGKDSTPENLRVNFTSVLFKIFTFSFLYMMFRMMSSYDFKENMDKERKRIHENAKEIAYKMAHTFNKKRISKNEKYKEQKNKLQYTLGKLDRWIDKQRATKNSDSGRNSRRSYGGLRHTFTSKFVRSQTKSLASKFQRLLIKWINPVLFENYMKKIKKSKKKDLEERLSPDEEPNLQELLIESSNTEYSLNFTNYLVLLGCVVVSNTQTLVYLFFIINHIEYASLESLVFPISVLGYAMLEYPRPPGFSFFRVMLLYTQVVFFTKYTFQLDIWSVLFGSDFVGTNKDSYKIGFNVVEKTYSQNLLYYTFWDVACMLVLLLHEFYLIKVGLHLEAEYQIETLEEAEKQALESPENHKALSYSPQESPRLEFRRRTESYNSEMPSQMDSSSFFEVELHTKKSVFKKVKEFYNRLIPRNKKEKPGTDYYASTFIVQFCILIYIFAFFSQIDGESKDISEALQSNQFSGRMVLALIIQIFIILLERYFYLERTSQAVRLATSPSAPSSKLDYILLSKLVLHMILLVLVHALIFWYFPINANIRILDTPYCKDLHERCSNFEVNRALQGFYVLYCVYFVIVCLQIRDGLPSYRDGTFPLMRHDNIYAKAVFQCYMALPFVFEIRTLVDWTFTKTALDFWQWFKFEDVLAQLYITKVIQIGYNARSFENRIGEPINGWFKCLQGGCVLFVILLIITGPLMLFSSLNPIKEANPLERMSVEIGAVVQNSNYYRFFLASRVTSVEYISDKEWIYMGFDKLKELTAEEKDLMQVLTIPAFSDSLWDITPPSKMQICNYLNQTLNEKGLEFSLEFVYNFERPYPPQQKVLTRSSRYPLDQFKLGSLHRMLCEEKESQILLSDFKGEVIKLPSSGDNIKPILVKERESNSSISMTLQRTDKSEYWEIGTPSKDQVQGLKFYIISENYSPVTFNFSVATFYISVVYVAGRLLRLWTGGGKNNLVLTEMPNPQPLIQLSIGVLVSRMTEKLAEEEIFYYELIDILRSPEMIKSITGTSSRKEKTD